MRNLAYGPAFALQSNKYTARSGDVGKRMDMRIILGPTGESYHLLPLWPNLREVGATRIICQIDDFP